LQDIDTAIECLIYADVLAVSSSDDEEDEDVEDTEIFGDTESLLVVRASIARQRYYPPQNTSAGRHHVDVLEAYIQQKYPETAFFALFRMHRNSFRHIVQLLTEAGGEGYWDQREIVRGYKRPIYQQIAVALYVLAVLVKGLELHPISPMVRYKSTEEGRANQTIDYYLNGELDG